MEPSPKVSKEVIEGCKVGNKKAFEEIVFRYQKKAFNMAYRILGNKEEARDLAQEVFVSVFESIKGLRDEIKFEAWLTQIILNHCRNRWNYLKRRRYFKTDSIDDPIKTKEGSMPRSLFDPSDNPEALCEKKMIQQFVQNGLLQLKEEQRELLVLRDIQGFSYEEMATLLQFPEGTIKSKIHRARMDLRKILERLSH